MELSRRSSRLLLSSSTSVISGQSACNDETAKLHQQRINSPCRLLSSKSPAKEGPHRAIISNSVKLQHDQNPMMPAKQMREEFEKLLPLYSTQKFHNYRNKVAVVDESGQFLFEDVYRRAHELAVAINDHLHGAVQQKIGLVTSNGVSFLISLWAVWLSGNVAVPLDAKDEKLEAKLEDSKCPLVITTRFTASIAHLTVKKLRRDSLCLDETWTTQPVKHFDTWTTELPKELLDKEFYELKPEAMILYQINGEPKGLRLDHFALNAQASRIASGWDLGDKDNCSVLHTLPLTHSYGVVTSVLSPLSVGGKVVLLPRFDTISVWSHLLGIPVNNSQYLAKVNFFPSVPGRYKQLLERHQNVFTDKKTKDYVRNACKKRLKAMVSSTSGLPVDFRKEWYERTGHNILDCYTTAKTGTVLSGKCPQPTDYSPVQSQSMAVLPGVEVKLICEQKPSPSEILVASDDRLSGTGELAVKAKDGGVALCGDCDSLKGMGKGLRHQNEEWNKLGDTFKFDQGKLFMDEEKS